MFKYSSYTVILLLVTPCLAFGKSEEAIETIEVIGHSPLSADKSIQQSLIGNIQQIDSDELSHSNQRNLAEILRNNLTSVNINDVQNNPFQPDLQYRGFTASPLLGLPQGISVYVDGVRFNEPFGDTLNWDLVPLNALDNVKLYSSSNPIFGQNTLGGAISLNTKSGFSYQDTELNLGIGDHGRKQASFQHGMQNKNWAFYALASDYHEDGWRDFSPSDLRQFFSKLSYANDDSKIDFNYMYADSKLLGNGAIPRLLSELQSPSAVFTHPDQTENQLDFFTLTASHQLTANWQINSNVFSRRNRSKAINGDDSDYGPCQFMDGRITLCELEDDDDDDQQEEAVEERDDDDLPIANIDAEAVSLIGYPNAALGDLITIELDDLDGTFNTGQSNNDSQGINIELIQKTRIFGKVAQNQFGFGAQRATINYAADTSFGILDNDSAQDSRIVHPVDYMDEEARVRLDVDARHRYAFWNQVTKLTDDVVLNLALRWNWDHILMNDLIEDGEGSLNGDHKFTQINPALGLSVSLSEDTEFNLSYAQSSRVPSPAELSCADENDPCRLPNGFVADPPLDQVITSTYEASLSRDIPQLNIKGIATLFHSTSKDDIIFQQAGTVASRGYFVNIDKTQRAGAEFSVSGQYDDFNFDFSYNYLDATFESPFTSFSPMNPLGANRQVRPGHTIPGQPKHQAKLSFDWWMTDRLTFTIQAIHASDQYYRGDEANENQKIQAYSLLNASANYDVSNNIALSLTVNNLLDEQYFTFGTYGEADEVLEDIYPEITEPHFVGPGHPRQISLHLRMRL